jgi:hypothetical protein
MQSGCSGGVIAQRLKLPPLKTEEEGQANQLAGGSFSRVGYGLPAKNARKFTLF